MIETNLELIDRFLKDEEFQQMVEEKIGPLIAPVRVEWNENKIKFFGRKQVFVLKIDETLEELRKKSPITDTNIKEINTKCQYCKRDLAEGMAFYQHPKYGIVCELCGPFKDGGIDSLKGEW